MTSRPTLAALAAALEGLRARAATWPAPSRRVILSGIALVVALVFPVGMLWVHKIDDNADFTPAPVAAPKARSIAMAAALIHREVDVNKWRANDPLFLPGGWLDNMPNYQLGVIEALAHVSAAMVGDKGAGMGPNGPDIDLNHAAGLLKYPGTVWKFDTRTSWMPTASAEKQYRNAQRSLDRYNDRIAAGTASFDRRPEALAVLVEALLRDLDVTAATIEYHLAEGRAVLLDFSADDVFYAQKGRLYALSLVMRELGRDYEKPLADRRQTEAWAKMVAQLAAAAHIRPWVVWSASPDSSLLPNHLTSQGFLTLRARMEAAEILAALKAAG
ncbi:conserved hypothetical protein [Candidatus Terasakiella magnetica]|nr:conserved hypothetical protein [Candidatus Terasakiella magnetica]